MLLALYSLWARLSAPAVPGQNPAFPYQSVATIVKCGNFFLWVERNVKSTFPDRLRRAAIEAGASDVEIIV